VKLRLLAEAEAEIESARRYLNRQAHELGTRFVDDLDLTLLDISERPATFSKLETLPDHSPYQRALLSTFRYAVIFELRRRDRCCRSRSQQSSAELLAQPARVNPRAEISFAFRGGCLEKAATRCPTRRPSLRRRFLTFRKRHGSNGLPLIAPRSVKSSKSAF
jgi:hypothetical protein